MVVDLGINGGEVTRCPGSDPTTQGGEFPGLQEKPHGQAAGAQLVFQVRSQDTGLNAGGLRGLVDFQDLVETTEVDRHYTSVAFIAGRVDAANHRGTAAEGYRRQIITAAPVQHGLDVRFVAHIGHGIGRVGKVAVMNNPRQVMYRGAIAVEQTVVFLRRAESLQCFRNCHAGRAKIDLALDGHWR